MSIGQQRRREEQQRKREEEWQYQANEQIRRAGDDLLARIPPERERTVDVHSLGGALPAKAELWARTSEDGRTVEFLRGETVCGWTSAEIIAQLGAPVDATLFQTIADKDGVLSLRVAPLDRRSLRPPTEDDDVH